MQPALQVSLYLKDRIVVVVGGSAAAEERVVRLIEAQARIVVVAKQITEPLARWATQGKLEHRAREYDAADLEGAMLVLVCEADASLADRIHAEASERDVLSYAQDLPAASDLAMPALVRRGGLRLAISTSEASPALAGRLRAELERLFDQTFVNYLAWLDDLRTRLRDEEPDPAIRAERLRAAVEGFQMNAVLHYPPAFLAIAGRRPVP